MRVSVGILAHNEQEHIASTILDVVKQDIFSKTNFEVKLHIIPNGCTDRTSDVANEVIYKLRATNIRFEVNVLEQPGKSNAWNIFVHKLAWQDADYLILVDADIVIHDTSSLGLLIESLIRNQSANVATSLPRKEIEAKKNKNVREKLSINVSYLDESKSVAICGQLYCIRGRVAREIYLPCGLPVEDGFISASVHTANFTDHSQSFHRVIRASSVSHYFEALLNPIALYKHEKRLQIGTLINSIIFNNLWKQNFKKHNMAGHYIRKMNQQDPLWVSRLVSEYRDNNGFWVVPKKQMFSYIRSWKKSKRTTLEKLCKLPLVILSTLITVSIVVSVNTYFHRNDGIGYW